MSNLNPQGVPAPPAMPSSMAQGTTATLPAAPNMGTAVGASLPNGVAAANPGLRLGSYLLESVLLTVTLGIGWVIWATMTAPTGQTPAKKLLKLRVISADTLQPVGLARMFWVRGLLAGIVASFAISFTLGILAFMPFWDKRRQNIWDKVSGTYVVTDPLDAWATKRDLR